MERRCLGTLLVRQEREGARTLEPKIKLQAASLRLDGIAIIRMCWTAYTSAPAASSIPRRLYHGGVTFRCVNDEPMCQGARSTFIHKAGERYLCRKRPDRPDPRGGEERVMYAMLKRLFRTRENGASGRWTARRTG